MKNKLMKKALSLSILFSCIGLTNTTYATDSTLEVKNYAVGINVEIKTDLLCGKIGGGIGPGSARYTTPLDENPIKFNQTKTASWKNCAIAEQKFFGDLGDHSKIYVKLLDFKTGDYVETVLHVERGNKSKNINFTNRNFIISMGHNGDYWNRGPYSGVYATQTAITVDEG